MWRIERKPWYQIWRPYEYELVLSSYGGIWGRSWTRRAAQRRLIAQQSQWFAES